MQRDFDSVVSQGQFVLSEWVDRLSNCLRDLVNYERSLESELLLLRHQGERVLGLPGAHYDSKDIIRERVSGYRFFDPRDPYINPEYRQNVSQRLTILLETLLEHPTLKNAAYTSGDEWMLGLDLGVSRTSAHQMIFMLRGLVDYAVEHTSEATADALAEVIQRGENHDLTSYSILLFCGLHVEQRHDFQGGLSIISFEEAQKYLSDSMLRSLLRTGTHTEREPVGAVVSEVKWGPAFAPVGYDMEEAEWPERSRTFRDDALLLVNLLAVTHRLPVVSTGGHTSSIERQVEHLVGLDPYSPRWLRDVPTLDTSKIVPSNTPTISVDSLSECAHLYSRMPKDDILLRLALSRLASSLSRTGIHAAPDKVIDVAIALEVMYQLDVSRGKGSQLSRRARSLVGRDREDMRWIGRTAESIYAVRNDIAHGELPKDTARPYQDGLELACRTLVHLVRFGRPSDWDQAVLKRRRR